MKKRKVKPNPEQEKKLIMRQIAESFKPNPELEKRAIEAQERIWQGWVEWELKWKLKQADFRKFMNSHIGFIPSETDTADTKTDTGKKSEKKPCKPRQLSAAAAACGLYVRQAMKDDPTLSRIQAVKDWADEKRHHWDRKQISVSSIDRQLQDNPHVWKPTADKK